MEQLEEKLRILVVDTVDKDTVYVTTVKHKVESRCFAIIHTIPGRSKAIHRFFGRDNYDLMLGYLGAVLYKRNENNPKLFLFAGVNDMSEGEKCENITFKALNESKIGTLLDATAIMLGMGYSATSIEGLSVKDFKYD